MIRVWRLENGCVGVGDIEKLNFRGKRCASGIHFLLLALFTLIGALAFCVPLGFWSLTERAKERDLQSAIRFQHSFYFHQNA
jgi:hypothetical protein